MPRTDTSFITGDGVTLRGWFYTASSGSSDKLPCIVMSHGFSAVKEMDLDFFASGFSSELAVTVLVYDQRGLGSSDTGPGQPRSEINPQIQISDLQDAITFAQTRPEVDPEKIGIWGSSYSGGHVLQVAAVDRRVKAVVSQVPFTNGSLIVSRLVRPDFGAMLLPMFAADRINRMKGEPAAKIPVADPNPLATSALPTPDSWTFFNGAKEKGHPWINEVTVRSMELLKAYNPDTTIDMISPTPLLMCVALNDTLTQTDLALKAYGRALEPKELQLVPDGHFDIYSTHGQVVLERQTAFWKKTLCA